jgi:hypothetical protein
VGKNGTLLFLAFWKYEELKSIWGVHGDAMKTRGPPPESQMFSVSDQKFQKVAAFLWFRQIFAGVNETYNLQNRV